MLRVHLVQPIHHVFKSYIQGKCMFTWCTRCHIYLYFCIPHAYLACVHMTKVLICFLKMADWTFEDVLAAIQSPPSIPTSVLQSADGLHLGDIHFAKIHTTLQMHAVSLALLEKWIDNGSFNLEHMADGDYSRSTAILLALTPDAQLKDIESVGVGLVVHWCGGLLGQISSVSNLISYVCRMLEFKRDSFSPNGRHTV